MMADESSLVADSPAPTNNSVVLDEDADDDFSDIEELIENAVDADVKKYPEGATVKCVLLFETLV